MRDLLCATCMEKLGPSGERQNLAGEYERVLRGVAKTPEASQRYLQINDVKKDLPLEFYNCDLCNAEIRAGESCGTWTVWTDRTGRIGAWEQEYIEL